MLDFFRRYQRYFYIVITVVTIISFSFFGTYSTLGSNTWREQLAFKAIDGREVTRADVDEMAIFLATDNEDKLLYGGIWGPNFLNDGVIRKDFLETGLAQELAAVYQEDLQSDLQRKLEKEKKYTPYSHPQARFLSVQSAWGYFIPEMNTHFQALRAFQTATDVDAFDTRVKLFLAEKKFPAPTLKQVLRYQEKQYNWLPHDSTLDQSDFSLFGYHTIEDWFGPSFTRLISQFIINAAVLAEQKGYQVSQAEVLADLVRQTELSYQQNKNKPYIGVTSPEEYLNEQLRRLNMDQSRAIKTWRQVMLFRRYFHDVGNSALVDVLSYQKINDFTQESVVVDLYQLPAALHLSDYASLQAFEAYLNAVTQPVKNDPLALSTQFLSINEISKSYPELIQKRYLLEINQVNKKALQARVGLKEMWNWELEDQNWSALKKQFPDLGIKAGETRGERFAALDSLDPITRAKADAFARSAIIDSHPEWLEKAFAEGKTRQLLAGLRPQGGKTPFEGLNSREQREDLIALLDRAPLGSEPTVDSKLYNFTADQQNYYRIKVLERASEPEILTFAEAKAGGGLDQIRDRILAKYYETTRSQQPLLYQKEDKTWKDFSSVKELVAEQYFEKVMKAIQQLQPTVAKNDEKPLSKDQIASLRFYTYLKKAKEQIEKDFSQSNRWVRAQPEEDKANLFVERLPLADQWLLEKTAHRLDRNGQQDIVNAQEAFALVPDSWSQIKTPVNGDLAFFQVKERAANPAKETTMANQVKQAHFLLSAEAQRVLMRQVLEIIGSKNAISLAYLNKVEEESIPSASEVTEPGF